MATITLEDGRKFPVDDSFKKLSPEQQGAYVEDLIAKHQVNTGQDVARSAVKGVTRGTIGLAGTPGDLQQLGTSAANYLRGKVGLGPAQEVMIPGDIPIPKAETSAQLEEMAGRNIPGVKGALDYQPQTQLGKLAETGGEFLPGAALGPGRMGAKALQWAGSTLGSEALGRAAEAVAPQAEPYARMAGAVIGGGVSTRGNRAQVAKTIPTTDEFERAKRAAYTHASMSGNTLHPQDFNYIIDDLTRMAEQRGGGVRNQNMLPGIERALSLMEERAALGTPLSVDDIDMMRQTLKKSINVMQPGERDLLRQMTDRYDQLVDHAVPPELQEARRLNVRFKKSEMMDELEGITARKGRIFTQSGDENAIRNQYRQLANAEARKRMAGRRSLFSQTELDRIDQVAMGHWFRNRMRDLGKYAPTSPISTLSAITLGGGAGYGVGRPGLGAALGAGLAGLGTVGRGIATKMARTDKSRAEELIRGGPHRARQAERLRQRLKREAVVRALLAGHQGFGGAR